MTHSLIIVLLTATLIFFSACDTDSTTDTDITLTSCLENKRWESCDLPEFTENNTSSFNLLGAYGDDINFGNKRIVGSWILYDMDENGSKISSSTYSLSSYDFFNDGTGNISTMQTSGYGITYGVSAYGESFITSLNHASSLPITYTIYGQKDGCYLVVKESVIYFSDATTHYFCKIQ